MNCSAITQTGQQCKRKAKVGGFCEQHAQKALSLSKSRTPSLFEAESPDIYSSIYPINFERRVPQEGMNVLRLLSWNISFDAAFLEQRLTHLLEQLREFNVDVIALQELRGDTWDVIISQLSDDYWASPVPRSKYFTGMLVSKRIMPEYPQFQRVFFENWTNMNRDLLLVLLPKQFIRASADLMIGTVHLESLNSQYTRAIQMNIIESLTTDLPDVVIMGDFNFDDRSNYPNVPRSKTKLGRLDNDDLAERMPSFNDAWVLKNPATNNERLDARGGGETFNAKTQAWKNNFTSVVARYDRSMTKLTSGTFEVDSVLVLGDQPVEYLEDGRPLFVSDHFAVETDIIIK